MSDPVPSGGSGLALQGLTVALGGRTVLHGIDLQAAAGSFLVLAGPSGSGKSTLLRAIAGLVDVQAGAVAWAGRPITALPPGQREIAMVFQDHALLPHLTVAENLGFGLRARGVSRREARARAVEVADRLGLAELVDRRITRLSGGERQRVALGRALLRDAKLVLMDEPLSSLDVPLRARLRREILELHRRQGWTTVYVTHDQAEALSMADQLGVMADGRLLQLDSPRRVYAHPASTAVARFIGAPPMNLLPVQVTGGVITWSGTPLAGLDPPGDGDWTLGLRPEDVHLTGSRWAPAGDDPATLEATVQLVEHVGDQQFVTVAPGHAPEAALTVRQEPDRVLAAGDVVRIGLSADALRWFAPDTGAAAR